LQDAVEGEAVGCPFFYLMEHEEENDRLEKKTDPSALRKQAK
jgi:hypothetical protein